MGLGSKLGAHILPSSGRLEENREATDIELGIHPLMSLLNCKDFKECTQSCTSSPKRCSLQDPEIVIETIQSNEEDLKNRAKLFFGDLTELNYVVGYNKYDGQASICIDGNWLLILKNVSSFFHVVQKFSPITSSFCIYHFLLYLFQINESTTDGDYTKMGIFSDLMAILDPAWSTVTAEIELSTRLCCGLTDLCFVSAWDLETLEIFNVENNTLSLAPGEVH